jgi:hypothetical protein
MFVGTNLNFRGSLEKSYSVAPPPLQMGKMHEEEKTN